MSTKRSIAEQVLYKIYGRASKSSDAIQLPDVIIAVGQMANALLRVQHLADMNLGENQPENLMIAEYPKVPLTTYGGKKSTATLPATPVRLIRNMGVWMVSTDEFFNCIGIPMGSGQMDLLRGQNMISDLMGQWGYEINGRKVITTRDLTIDGTDGLYFRLLISDIAFLSEDEPMPVPADYEAEIVQSVYQSFMPSAQPVRTVDPYLSSPQKMNKL